MISGVGLALFLIYLAIGMITTISVDALAIALIDEDVYVIDNSAPANSNWENLFWKGVSVVVSPLILTAYAGTSVYLWMQENKSQASRQPENKPQGNIKQGNHSRISHPEYRQIVIETLIDDANVCECQQISGSFHLY